ncbi:MAG: hypothetical protein EBY83_08155, partial [Verrucomicrobia bacterium]|nr:hypothetical protein [Verrucomicrobiota bacterium]
VKIENGQILYGGFVVHNTLTDRIIKMMSEGFKFDHMVKFLENLMQNPSARGVSETYWFLENYGLPITDDGCFLAYKAVRSDYTDIYSGKFLNSVGSVVSMPRNMVDDNYGIDCSKGLHVGALDYVVGYGHFVKGEVRSANGNRLLIVKVNPKDVVSVPKYEGHTKMRVCEYTVASEILDVVKELDKVVYTSNAEEINTDWDYNQEPTDGACEDDYSCDSKSSTTSKVDTTSPWNAEAYSEGYELGESDLNGDMQYGTSRDYSRENSYRIGYNDGYNQRTNQADSDIPDDEHADDDEYTDGYIQGEHDARYDLPYQTNLTTDASDEHRDGYSDGFNDHVR